MTVLDVSDGHDLWSLRTTGGGEHFGSDFAMGGDRVAIVSNIGPQLRVLDGSGRMVLGARLETKGVVSTEVIGTFVEDVRGLTIIPPFLLFARAKIGLDVYRLP